MPMSSLSCSPPRGWCCARPPGSSRRPGGLGARASNPGLVLTPDWKKTATKLTVGTGSTPQAYLDDIAKKNAPIGRFATPEGVADFFVFRPVPNVSRQVLHVDGLGVQPSSLAAHELPIHRDCRGPPLPIRGQIARMKLHRHPCW